MSDKEPSTAWKIAMDIESSLHPDDTGDFEVAECTKLIYAALRQARREGAKEQAEKDAKILTDCAADHDARDEEGKSRAGIQLRILAQRLLDEAEKI